MIDAQKTALEFLRKYAPEADTPAPWDLDEEYAYWAIEWGDEAEHGLIFNKTEDYTVCLDHGDKVERFDGLMEALEFAKNSFEMVEA